MPIKFLYKKEFNIHRHLVRSSGANDDLKHMVSQKTLLIEQPTYKMYKPEMIEYIVTHGGDINASSPDDNSGVILTPLDKAMQSSFAYQQDSEHSDNETLETMLNHGARVSDFKHYWESTSEYGLRYVNKTKLYHTALLAKNHGEIDIAIQCATLTSAEQHLPSLLLLADLYAAKKDFASAAKLYIDATELSKKSIIKLIGADKAVALSIQSSTAALKGEEAAKESARVFYKTLQTDILKNYTELSKTISPNALLQLSYLTTSSNDEKRLEKVALRQPIAIDDLNEKIKQAKQKQPS